MRWYFVFFLVSGFCSLVYEVVWLRLAMAAFGVTTPIVSLVLSAFMGGLGLGSWLAGSLLHRRLRAISAPAALRLYALTELLIGVSGLLVQYQLAWGHLLLEGTVKSIPWESSAYYVVSGAWIGLSLVPWCACMGATFPFVMAAIRGTSGTESQRSFSYLYVANVLGALLGTLFSAYLLIELLGFRGTLEVTTTLNGLLAAAALAASLSLAPSGVSPATVSEEVSPRRLYGLPEPGVLVLLFMTGLVSMAMELVWIRQFTPYLGNVVYAFAMILAVYLVATSQGSRDYRSWVRSHDPKETALMWAVLGLLALVPLATADPMLPVPQGHFTLGVVRVAVGIVAFCALVGFLTPAGRAYAVNVAGSIVGPLLAGFWLLPWVGERWALIGLSLPLFAAGVLAASRVNSSVTTQAGARFKTRFRFGLGALLAILLVSMTHGYEQRFSEHEVRRDYVATVIATGTGFHKLLLVNGVGMTHLSPDTKFMAHLPLAFLTSPPKDGLVICFGMGTTFRSMSSWGIRSTAVDLVPSVPAAFAYFHPDAPEIMRSPLTRIVVDDGRRFLDGSTDRYDVITVDPPPPTAAPTSSLLYSREFYAIVKQHLRPGGILQEWLPKTGADAATLASVAKALRQSFPYLRVFESVEGIGFHFLASMEPIPPTSSADLAARLPRAAAADLVEWSPESTAEQQFQDVLTRERSVESFEAKDPRVPALEDDQPINEYFFLRDEISYYR
ncbi:MAG TPA: hypothetical protein VG204_06860 [Terriglobia bacterium]|nr:hypothetical protein [Terriglobia bacterium]